MPITDVSTPVDQPAVVPFAWPETWGNDPTSAHYDASGIHRESIGNAWWGKPLHRRIRAATEATEWETIWEQSADWSENSDAFLALRAVVTKSSMGSDLHTISLAKSLRENKIPDGMNDVWAEGWMRQKQIGNLCKSRPDTPARELFDAMLLRWPAVFVWTGQQHQDFRHPLATAACSGQIDNALAMMKRIPPADWLSWDGSYESRAIWRDKGHWFAQDAAWILSLIAYDPRVTMVDPKTGLGPIEQAARDHLPDIVSALIEKGVHPNPASSFGQKLMHWAVSGMSEQKWNHAAQAYFPKTPQEIEISAVACGRALGILSNIGFSMEDVVDDVPRIPGVRRRRGLPKVGVSATQMLRDRVEKGELKDTTIARIQQAFMISVTPKIATAVAPSRSSRL